MIQFDIFPSSYHQPSIPAGSQISQAASISIQTRKGKGCDGVVLTAAMFTHTNYTYMEMSLHANLWRSNKRIMPK